MQPRNEERRSRARTISAIIAHNIREHRTRQGMTQADCSRLLSGAKESYWRQIENNLKDLSILRLVEISDVLQVQVGELMEGL